MSAFTLFSEIQAQFTTCKEEESDKLALIINILGK
jgi:hypothetical protein